MDNEQFTGRAEKLVKQLLTNPFGIREIRTQVNMKHIAPSYLYDFYDEEIQKHNFDLVLYRKTGEVIVVEVNYEHGPKADRKSNRIFEPDLKNLGISFLRIDDYECDFLFDETQFGLHKLTTNDMRDLLNAFDLSKVMMN